MNPHRRPHRRGERGAALAELVLILPILVSTLFFSAYLVDLVRARLRAHELARYVAFESTSYVLSDYGAGRHEAAFAHARERILSDAQERFADLDSIESQAGSLLGLEHSPPAVTLENQPVGLPDVPLDLGDGTGEAVSAVKGGAAAMTSSLGFDPNGKVEAHVSLSVSPRFLTALPAHELTARYCIVSSSWFLPDGADATVGDSRSGVRRTGRDSLLRQQVARMKFFGTGTFQNKLGNVAGLKSLVSFGLPDPDATFVVSHNYSNDPAVVRDVGQRGCTNDLHSAKAGLQNLAQSPGIDDDGLRCFDTAPFRDTHAYSDSLYKQMFDERGANFQGCREPMADDPVRCQ